MKRFDESVRAQLGAMLIKHGRSPLTDARLCENLLKDYCPQHKEEIALLALAVKERIAGDLLVSQEGLDRNLLRALLVKRLRKAAALSEGDARWAVESWGVAIRALARAEPKESSIPIDVTPVTELNPLNSWSKSGIIARFTAAIRSLAVSPIDDTIVVGGADGVIRIFTPCSGEITTLRQCDGPVWSVAFSPNGVLVASASMEHGSVTDVQSREVTVLGQIGKQSASLAFSPGGKSLAAASTDAPCEIHVWNLQTGGTRVFKGSWKGPASISFSPDGSTLATADSDLSNPSIRLWDAETGTARVLGRSTRQITSVAYLPDGKRVVSGSWDETVRVWDVQTGEARILGKNCSCISHLAISSDGERIAAASLDGRIRVWDIQTGRSRTIGECYGLTALAFTTVIVTGGEDGTLRLWDTDRF